MLFLGVGPISEQIAAHLCVESEHKIFTNNINIARILNSYDQGDVVLIGGMLNKQNGGAYDYSDNSLINALSFDVVLLEISSIDKQGSRLVFEQSDAHLKTEIVRRARTKILVAENKTLSYDFPRLL